MKIQYLGDSKDSFKWDYHDYLTRRLGYSTLNVVLMATEDWPSEGNSLPEDYPASKGILDLCRELRKRRNVALHEKRKLALKQMRNFSLLCHLPEKTNSEYTVELHKGDSLFTLGNRQDYFEGFCDQKDQVVLVDPDTGFETKRMHREKHVRFHEITRIVEQISIKSVVSVFQFSRRGQRKDEFRKRYEEIIGQLGDSAATIHSTAIYWDSKVMFVLLSQSQELIQRIYKINERYRQDVMSRCGDSQIKLELCE